MNIEKWDEKFASLVSQFEHMVGQKFEFFQLTSLDKQLVEKLIKANKTLELCKEKLTQVEVAGSRARFLQDKGKFTVIWSEAFAKKMKLYLDHAIQVKYLIMLLNILRVRFQPKQRFRDFRIDHKTFLSLVKLRQKVKQDNKVLEDEVKTLEKAIRGMWREQNYQDVVKANAGSLAPQCGFELQGKKIQANVMTEALDHFFSGIAYEAYGEKIGSRSLVNMYNDYLKKGQDISKFAYDLMEKTGFEKRHAWELGYALPQAERMELLQEFAALEKAQARILGTLPSQIRKNLRIAKLKVVQRSAKKAKNRGEFLRIDAGK